MDLVFAQVPADSFRPYRLPRHLAPIASFELLEKAVNIARKRITVTSWATS